MDVLYRAIVLLGVLLVLVVFFLFYRRIWGALTDEPFTYIIRRNRWRFSSILALAVGLIAWGVLDSREVSGETYGLLTFLYGVLVGHFYWCSCRPGKLHAPTAYRLLDRLAESGQTDGAAAPRSAAEPAPRGPAQLPHGPARGTATLRLKAAQHHPE